MRLFACLLLTGCVSQFKSSSGTTTTQSDDPIENTGLPSLLDNMDTEYCNNIEVAGVQGSDIAGATSYFWGTYVRADEELGEGMWLGREQWILHPTDSWDATDGRSCFVTWEMVAEELEPQGCPTCDLGLSVSAQINRISTDCPDGLWEEEQSWDESYDIAIDGETTRFFYHTTGNEFGLGYAENSALSFLTSPNCTWF